MTVCTTSPHCDTVRAAHSRRYCGSAKTLPQTARGTVGRHVGPWRSMVRGGLRVPVGPRREEPQQPRVSQARLGSGPAALVERGHGHLVEHRLPWCGGHPGDQVCHHRRVEGLPFVIRSRRRGSWARGVERPPVRAHGAGIQDAHPDPVRTALSRQRLREAGQGELRRAVGRCSRPSPATRDRGDVHDQAAAAAPACRASRPSSGRRERSGSPPRHGSTRPGTAPRPSPARRCRQRSPARSGRRAHQRPGRRRPRAPRWRTGPPPAARHGTPCSRTSSAVRARSCSLRPRSATSAPAEASRTATARPSPLVAPVTRAPVPAGTSVEGVMGHGDHSAHRHATSSATARRPSPGRSPPMWRRRRHGATIRSPDCDGSRESRIVLSVGPARGGPLGGAGSPGPVRPVRL